MLVLLLFHAYWSFCKQTCEPRPPVCMRCCRCREHLEQERRSWQQQLQHTVEEQQASLQGQQQQRLWSLQQQLDAEARDMLQGLRQELEVGQSEEAVLAGCRQSISSCCAAGSCGAQSDVDEAPVLLITKDRLHGLTGLRAMTVHLTR